MLKKYIVLFACFMLFALPASASASYTVKKGDTLWKIAYKNNVTTKTLVSLNPEIKNPNSLEIGQSIAISKQVSESAVQEVVDLVNVERKKAGLAALAVDAKLTEVAQLKSQDMQSKKYFSHTSPTYGSPFDMMKKLGVNYKSAGENIAMGQTSAKQVVDAWMNSAGHRANILDSKFTHIGVGYVKKGHYWTQMFIKK